MATISTLAVNLIARTSAFEKGMGRSKRSVKSLKATVTGAVGTIARFAKGLAIAAGVGGMGFMIKKTMATIDATAKLSDRIGIATEALVGLQHAANIAGVSNEALNKSLEIFVRRMGEITTGSGEAKKGLELLGLTAEQMIQMTPDKSLKIIAERIKLLGTQAEKSAAAYFLFGRAGAQLINLFEEGADGIAALQAEAVELGLTFSRFDAAQVEAANDAITRLKASMKGLVNEITVKLAPALKKIADFMTKYRDGIISTIKKTAIFVAKTFLIVNAVKLVVGAIRGLVAIYQLLNARQAVTLALGGPAGWAVLAAGVVIATAAIVGLNKTIDDTIDGITGVRSTVGDIPKAPKILTGDTEIRAELLKTEKSIAFWTAKITEERGKDRLAGDIALRQMKAKAKSLEGQLSIMRDQRRAQDALAQQAKERQQQIKKQTETFAGLNKFIDGIKQKFDEIGLSPLEAQLERLKKTGEGLMGEAGVEFARGIAEATKLIKEMEEQNAFEKLADEAKNFADSLKTPEERLIDVKNNLKKMFEQGLISAEQFAKGLSKATQDMIGDTPGLGRFQEVRSEFIDVAALSAGSKDQKLDVQNQLTRRTNELLIEIQNENRAVSLR